MSNIHDYHNGLHPAEKKRMADSAESQERLILKMLQGKPDHFFPYFEIKNITGWDKDSVKRSLSNLSGSIDRYKDENGNYPVLHHKDKRKKNPDTGATCGTYRVNPAYGKVGQLNAFGEPESKFKNGVAL